jgi:hypothetical protein
VIDQRAQLDRCGQRERVVGALDGRDRGARQQAGEAGRQAVNRRRAVAAPHEKDRLPEPGRGRRFERPGVDGGHFVGGEVSAAPLVLADRSGPSRPARRTPGTDLDEARDLAFVLSNAETYLQFADVCGWTPQQWQQRIGAALAAALLAQR